MSIPQSVFKKVLSLFVTFIVISLLLIFSAVIIQFFHPQFFASPIKRGIFAGFSVILLGVLFLIHVYKQFKKYEEDLSIEHHKTTFLKSLFNSFPYPIFFINEKNEIMMLNSSAEAFLGEPLKEKIHVEDLLKKFSPQSQKALMAIINSKEEFASNLLKTQDSNLNEEASFFESSSFPVRSNEGSIIGKILFLLDKTNEIKSQLRESELKEKLLIMQKHEALSRLSGSVAHDINNILAIILSNAELIASMSTDENAKKHAEVIIQSSKRAGKIITSLLSYAKGKPAKEEVIDLIKIIKEFAEFLEASVPQKIKLRFEIDEKEILVKGSAIQIEQIILNVIDNAVDAIKDEGEIALSVKKAYVDENKASFYGYVNPGTYACISIMDTGIGMSKEEIERIFEPYYTTKEKGSGLGLSIVYGIVRKFNGFIEVESEKGKGTEFKIYIPEFRF